MADKCVTADAKKRFAEECKKKGPLFGSEACYKSQIKLCPPADVQPVIQVGADGINLLGVYQICNPKPVELAFYPPTRPMPNEAAAQAAYEKLTGTAQKQLSATMALRTRAARARKIEVGWGFWLGAGLCGVGALALHFTRR